MACALDGYLATRLSRAGELHLVDHAAQALAATHAEALPSRLITQIGLTGDDCFGPDPRATEYMEPGVSHKRTAAESVSY